MTYNFRVPLRDYHNFYKNSQMEKNNYIYLLKDNKVLKLLVTIDKRIIKESLYTLSQNLEMNDYKVVYIDPFERHKFLLILRFKRNHKLGRLNQYIMPDKNIDKCKLIYIINDIYNENTLSNGNICDLNRIYEYYSKFNNGDKIATKWVEVINFIIDNLEIEVMEEYDYDTFKSSLDFTEMITDKENLSLKMYLSGLKNILLSAQKNKDIFESLNIQLEKEYRK